MKPLAFLLLLFWLQVPLLNAQTVVSDSAQASVKTAKITSDYSLRVRNAIIPITLISFGLIGLDNDVIEFVNSEVREEVTENIDERVSIDDFLQFAPAALVYVFDAAGLQHKSSFKDQLRINALSMLIVGTTVTSMKYTFKVERPDHSSNNSFPSGHTATAFANAEFLFQEYRDENPWLASSGYVAAAFVGGFRIANNRHWVTDVCAGAGIGILSTKAAYWILEKRLSAVNHTSQNSGKSVLLLPFVNDSGAGLGMHMTF